jgi:diguanylate cyclase (GGDEF)-like protein
VSSGLDYALFWRRALLAATATRAVTAMLGAKDAEETFLAALIQDIGIMALDSTVPDLYADLGPAQIHQKMIVEREVERVGSDHAEVGAWLLARWSFPERIQQAVRASHEPERVSSQGPDGLFVRSVAFSGQLAELFLEPTEDHRYEELAANAESMMGLDKEGLATLIADIGNMIPDAESVFQTKLLRKEVTDAILEDAREALMLRNLMALKTVDTLKEEAEALTNRTRSLEQASQRDGLTGLYNRAFLDRNLVQEFDRANASDLPLSVAFADLDRFKAINDTHGHGAGDQILIAIANILKANVRQSDIVARYGGEEFILVFPDTDFMLVKAICERITRSIQATRHDIEGGSLPVTISMGLATHNNGRRFESVTQLVNAADKALYSAKLQGRNRSIPFEAIADAQSLAG